MVLGFSDQQYVFAEDAGSVAGILLIISLNNALSELSLPVTIDLAAVQPPLNLAEQGEHL